MKRKARDGVCRWEALAQKAFKDQIRTPEFYALGAFFSLNVLALQLYLGTARVQLEEMSSNYKLYVEILSFVVPGELQNAADVIHCALLQC
jgi:hypothetical protein